MSPPARPRLLQRAVGVEKLASHKDMTLKNRKTGQHLVRDEMREEKGTDAASW